MPPWPAHQCRAMVSRHVHALFRPTITLYPNFSRPFQRTSPCFTTAAFAGESFPHLEDGFIATGTIITHSVDNTTPDNLIAQIPNLQWKFKSNAAEPLALFLLTPSFATWLLDDKTFLEKALHKAYRRTIRARAMYPTRIHAVVAVVDRLPAPSSAVLDQLQPPSSTTGSPSTGARSISLPSLYSGHEGIAYAFMRHSSMLSTIRQGPTEDTNGAHDNGSSTISIHAPYEFYTPSKSPQDSSTCNTIVQFPLANTVFQTGCSSTMFSSVWDIPIEKITALAEKTRLKHLSISWPFNLPSKATVSIPLIPLTVPRKIEAGMGNIIRRILGPGSKSMTASQELEETVPKYFKAQGIPPQAMKVWALLIPETALSSIHGILSELLAQPATGSVDMSSSFQTLWKSNLPLRNEIVSYALSKGARLHRVLSGGGGWGKKAGLLSLDPDQFYGSTLSPRTSGLDINDILEEIPSGFHEVAKSGEFVQFFVSPSEFVPTYQNHHNNLNSTRGNSPTLHSLELGTIPSSIDSIPTSRIPKDVLQSTIPKVSVFQNHFGVLSEGGINIHALRQNETGGPWKTQTKTKIDVPFSRYSSLGAALRKTKLLVRRCKNESSPYIRKIITSKSLVNVIEHSHPIAIESQISERNRVEPSLRIRRIPSDSPLVKVYVSQSGETSVGAKPPCSQSVQNSKGNPSTTVAFQFVQNPKPTSSTSAQVELPRSSPSDVRADGIADVARAEASNHKSIGSHRPQHSRTQILQDPDPISQDQTHLEPRPSQNETTQNGQRSWPTLPGLIAQLSSESRSTRS
ncbi:hypothetical protein K432DRAFT_153288 [Lepidopterella palustris CBS 459.81]|uniref:Uncharacterized protein n=1 Tax=Lepidopterella palustris CBS 459.81 TaxID=1314670 RepID=A0A8E2E2V2_9PEZI|nr:hypothetical protein K432DRAFT_153288 [Lepidopterella palustris CBS 459.81]